MANLTLAPLTVKYSILETLSCPQLTVENLLDAVLFDIGLGGGGHRQNNAGLITIITQIPLFL